MIGDAAEVIMGRTPRSASQGKNERQQAESRWGSSQCRLSIADEWRIVEATSLPCAGTTRGAHPSEDRAAVQRDVVDQCHVRAVLERFDLLVAHERHALLQLPPLGPRGRGCRSKVEMSGLGQERNVRFRVGGQARAAMARSRRVRSLAMRSASRCCCWSRITVRAPARYLLATMSPGVTPAPPCLGKARYHSARP